MLNRFFVQLDNRKGKTAHVFASRTCIASVDLAADCAEQLAVQITPLPFLDEGSDYLIKVVQDLRQSGFGLPRTRQVTFELLTGTRPAWLDRAEAWANWGQLKVVRESAQSFILSTCPQAEEALWQALSAPECPLGRWERVAQTCAVAISGEYPESLAAALLLPAVNIAIAISASKAESLHPLWVPPIPHPLCELPEDTEYVLLSDPVTWNRT